ncbi:CMRF35-like molecule 6 isoform X2 [Moschus berezovskii]|uniref:CMRF35-like molecule 6 isoform X2 n=1 Tax=Moschus berezovskii TaxID=68408 RepID=UPI002444437E|nr:CMRF35-like molecule 6 isoform X2 [Moschus berezovskii]
MTLRGRAGWLPSALLLLQLPGCLSLSGPRRVTGIVGGSLSVECQYQEEFINNSKFWCKPPCVLLWKMMQTTESAREVRRGHVSIRDRPANLTFTVTLERLREEDAGTYWCGINVPLSINPTFEVEVSVIPATIPERSTGSPGSPTTLPVPTWSTASGQETPDPSQAPRPLFILTPDCEGPTTCLVLCCRCRPLLGSAHFLLLVFLKVPLLLGMLGAILWVHRPLRSSESR